MRSVFARAASCFSNHIDGLCTAFSTQHGHLENGRVSTSWARTGKGLLHHVEQRSFSACARALSLSSIRGRRHLATHGQKTRYSRFFLILCAARGMRGGARCCAAGLALLLAAGNVLPEHTRTHTLGPLTPTAKIGLLLVARAGLPPTNGDGDRGGSDRGIRGGSGGTALRAPRAGMTCKAELGAERLPILGLQAARSGSPEPNPKP